MKPLPRRRFVLLVVVLCGAGVAAPLFGGIDGLSAAMYLLATSVATFELVDVGTRLWLGMTAAARIRNLHDVPATVDADRMRPYAVILSVHNLRRDIDVVTRALLPYKQRTWIVDDASSDETPLYLQANGWRCLASRSNAKKPGALKTLLRMLPQDVATVLVLDPDVVVLDAHTRQPADLDAVVRRFQRSGNAACCPRIRIRPEGPLTMFQFLECELAFSLGRKGMSPYAIASGAALYDRRALERVLERHSLSVYAEDLENSLLLFRDGGRIGYDDTLLIETEGRGRLAAWFSQRVGWSYGLFKVVVERRAELAAVARKTPWNLYNFGIYLTLLSVVLLPVKLIGVGLLCASLINSADELLALGVVPNTRATDPGFFAATYVTYTVLLAAIVMAIRPRVGVTTLLVSVPLFIFYAVVHVVPMTVGYLNWFSVKLSGRRVYRDHYSAEGESASRLSLASQQS